MKKINFIIALSLLCCSYESMGFARRPEFNRTTVNRQSSTQNQQQTIKPGTVVTDPAYVRPSTNTDRLAGISLPSVTVTEEKRKDQIFNGSKFALIEVKDKNNQNPGGNSCGYNALHTTRQEVYNALKGLYYDNWKKLNEDEQKHLKAIMSNVLSLDFDQNLKMNNYTQNHWPLLNNVLQQKILHGKNVLGDNLGALICYIRGENLRTFQSSLPNKYQGFKFNNEWSTRYLYNLGNVNTVSGIGGSHWQELRPYDINDALTKDTEYIFSDVFQP